MGDIFVWDPTQLTISQLKESAYQYELDLTGKEMPLNIPLHIHCTPKTAITLTGCIGDEADRIGINLCAPPTYKLRHKAHTELENFVLHFNPRFTENCVVRNSMIDGKWGEEEREGGLPLIKGQEFTISFVSTGEVFVIYVNGEKFINYKHRLPPESVASLSVWGKLQPFKLVVESPEIILAPMDLYWRQVGGHLRRVESCGADVTWGIAYDHTLWVYTGGWGGGFFGNIDSHNIHAMTDTQDYRVYENQRWNPVTGYTSSGNVSC